MAEVDSNRPCWFVGAAYGGTDDRTAHFLKEGIWEHGYEDKWLEEVRSMQPGDRIAIKATYKRKKGLPFDNRGHTVAVMAIKAIGTIAVNPMNGRRVQVEWEPQKEPREWYFYIGFPTVWRVTPGYWKADALISFTFEGKPQELSRFRNDPLRRARFGDSEELFKWTRFYEAVADGILKYKGDRTKLVAAIHDIIARTSGTSYLTDTFSDGSKGPLRDICPFTAMGTFNRGIKDKTRKTLAKELAAFLGVSERVPTSFEGVPILNNMKSWFFQYERDRDSDAIDALWHVFEQALHFANSGQGAQEFEEAFDRAMKVHNTGWNLTMGLYWIRPKSFPTLESQSKTYIKNMLGTKVGREAKSGAGYLELRSHLLSYFKGKSAHVRSFPELSYAAWRGEDSSGEYGASPPEKVSPEIEVIDSPTFDAITDLLRETRTHAVLLYGPAGTGKTFAASKIAKSYGGLDGGRVEQVQFHPAYSFEDFIEGLRPEETTDGGVAYTVKDGIFKAFCKRARQRPAEDHLFIIDEVNRGNVPKVMGELMYCLEYRGENHAVKLPYGRNDHGSAEHFYIPENVHILGTMNSSDRSVAMLDVALRRRFHFVELLPDLKLLEDVTVEGTDDLSLRDTLETLNDRILELKGRHYLLGHSYFLPHITDEGGEKVLPLPELKQRWFHQILPLLEEYFADDVGALRRVIGNGWEVAGWRKRDFFIPRSADIDDESFVDQLAGLDAGSDETSEVPTDEEQD